MDVGIAAAWLLDAIFSGGLIPDLITFTAYCVLTIYYLWTSRLSHNFTPTVKALSAMALMLWFFKLYARLIVLLPPFASKGATSSAKLLQILGNEFNIMFLTTLILSPLIISIYREKYILIGSFVFAPTFAFSTVMGALNFKKIIYTIGCPSSHLLGFAAALNITALVIRPFIRLLKQKGDVSKPLRKATERT